MSYVSIWKPVNERIVEAALDSENEIIGLLLGRLEKDTIVIVDSITGEYSAEQNRVILPPQTLARIADDLVNGRVQGNVVGWYHSHVQNGLFFSGTDSQTQKKLQQFSPLVVGMVVDATNGTTGYYRVNSQTGKPDRMPEERLRIFEEPAAAIPPEVLARPPVSATPVIEVRKAPTQLRLPARKLILVLILIALILTAVGIGGLLYRGMTSTRPLSINHIPILTATIGTPIEVRTNVTGSAQVVRLLYTVVNSGSLVVAGMGSAAPGQYSYVIPADQVIGNIIYYIEAVDKVGNLVSSNRYQIQIADFRLIVTNTTLTVYRAKSVTSILSLLPINGFNKPVTLSASGLPPGLSISFGQNPLPSGVTSTTMDLGASQQAANGTFTIPVTATYLPSNAVSVARQTVIVVTVADFSLQVAPTSSQISVGGFAVYQLTLTIQPGFADRVDVSVQGLPPEAVATLSSTGSTLGIGPGTTILALQIATLNVKPATYPLTITASGGGVVHHEMVQLTVR